MSHGCAESRCSGRRLVRPAVPAVDPRVQRHSPSATSEPSPTSMGMVHISPPSCRLGRARGEHRPMWVTPDLLRPGSGSSGARGLAPFSSTSRLFRHGVFSRSRTEGASHSLRPGLPFAFGSPLPPSAACTEAGAGGLHAPARDASFVPYGLAGAIGSPSELAILFAQGTDADRDARQWLFETTPRRMSVHGSDPTQHPSMTDLHGWPRRRPLRRDRKGGRGLRVDWVIVLHGTRRAIRSTCGTAPPASKARVSTQDS